MPPSRGVEGVAFILHGAVEQSRVSRV
jgi:hypothetical protein